MNLITYRTRFNIAILFIVIFCFLALGCDTETSPGTSTSIVTSQTTRGELNGTYYTPVNEEMTSPSVIFNTTVISVLAVCSVIIVLVLAGTVIFVVRKRGITHTGIFHHLIKIYNRFGIRFIKAGFYQNVSYHSRKRTRKWFK